MLTVHTSAFQKFRVHTEMVEKAKIIQLQMHKM